MTRLVLKSHHKAIESGALVVDGKVTTYGVAGMPSGFRVRCKPGKAPTYEFRYQVGRGGDRVERLVTIGKVGVLAWADASTIGRDIATKVERGEDPVGAARERKQLVAFGELVDAFMVEASIADNTKQSYRWSLEKDVLPAIGEKPASDVTKADVKAVVAKIASRGAKSQADHTRAAIGGVFRWAIKAGRFGVEDNPCAGIAKQSPKGARTRTPTDAEIAALWTAIHSPEAKLSAAMRDILKLAILTGQRRTEIAGARIDELVGLGGEAAAWVIAGHELKRGKVIRGRTKNGREQVVPLVPEVAAIWTTAIGRVGGGEYVFPADLSRVKVGAKPRKPHIHGESVTKAMVRLRKATGVADVTVHDMRRAISTYLKERDFSRDIRDAVLNHIDGSVTGQHYEGSASMKRQVRAALSAWVAHVLRIVDRGSEAAAGNVVPLRA